MKRLIPFLLFFLASCFDKNVLHKKTDATGNEPYLISIVGKNDKSHFYFKLADSLQSIVKEINGVGISDNKDNLLVWLQKQFDEPNYGISQKASSQNLKDRTSDELHIKNIVSNKLDLFCFSTVFRTDSIPSYYLYPTEWKKITRDRKVQKKIVKEKEKFNNGGLYIRTQNGVKDSLFGYSYSINVEISINYKFANNDSLVQKKIILPTEAVIYHQPKFL